MSDTPVNAAAPLTFEAGLRELESIVKEMEGADLPLERALELFERGTKLSEACRKQLHEAETRVEILMKRAGAAADEEKVEARRLVSEALTNTEGVVASSLHVIAGLHQASSCLRAPSFTHPAFRFPE